MSTRPSEAAFDAGCTQCRRLSDFLTQIGTQHPNYHAGPVPPFGDAQADLLIVGLAPGMHGANRTGRPFTGDHAGILLYRTLFDFGFSTAPVSQSADDGLRLHGARITNAVKCLPPQNKPVGAEIRNCNRFLRAELEAVPPGGVILALGKIAHDAVLRALNAPPSRFPFAHAAEHALDRRVLLDSYHCSRYNTQTRRLTDGMFKNIFERVRELLAPAPVGLRRS